MYAKYALALLLALQVSMCLCDGPTPSAELVQKYNDMKSVFYKRLLTAHGKMIEILTPDLLPSPENDGLKFVAEGIEKLKNKTIGAEAQPLVDRARAGALGAYEYYLRPQIGVYLNDAIDTIKAYLDIVLPAE
uniref:Uncharacterized protein n=1 Tax=Mola mola TaxID=94237 RepID=A0A3Q3WAV2_MOLML